MKNENKEQLRKKSAKEIIVFARNMRRYTRKHLNLPEDFDVLKFIKKMRAE